MIISAKEYNDLVALTRETERYRNESARLQEDNERLRGRVEDLIRKVNSTNALLDDISKRLDETRSELKHQTLLKQSIELRRGTGGGL